MQGCNELQDLLLGGALRTHGITGAVAVAATLRQTGEFRISAVRLLSAS